MVAIKVFVCFALTEHILLHNLQFECVLSCGAVCYTILQASNF